jgi:competence protein ComEA
MDKRTNSQTIGLITVMIVITCVVAYFSLRSTQRQSLPPLIVNNPQSAAASTSTVTPAADPDSSRVTNEAAQSSAASVTSEIVVHVAGAVFRPDVYRLPIGSRVNDAIRAAGGATQVADTNSINLAAPVQDGSKIYVPQYGEMAAQQPAQQARSTGAPSNTASSSNSQSQASQADIGAQAGDGDQSQTSGKLTDPVQGAVNINTADAGELQRLPGVGPAIAQRIIDYRQSIGGFKTAEELKNVSGIGDKKYAKLAAFVTVG